MFDYAEMWSGLSTDDISKARVCIMGVPFDGGASLGKGASLAPRAIRLLTAADMPEVTEDRTILKESLIYDAGDVVPDLDWEEYFQEVEDRAHDLMTADTFCLFIGGDHSVSIPLHKAFGTYQRKKNNLKLGIIHLDAHADLCDNFDGHKWSHANTGARALESTISPKDLCLVGVRAFEQEEIELLDSHPEISVYTAQQIDQDGVADVCTKIIDQFKEYDAVYLTLDIDVLDPAFAPGTGTPVAGGLSSRELIEIVKTIMAALPVKAMDIVEVAPPLDVNDITSWAAIRIMHEVFGYFSNRAELE